MRRCTPLWTLMVCWLGLIPQALGKMPLVADGWKIELVAEAPRILYPTAIAVARDGTIYLGQDPMDMPGPPTEPNDSIIAIKDGQARVFADKLWAVMGLEWVDGTLYVVHAPYLSALRDTDGDGRADARVDLITSLGPTPPGFNGINDHVASGIRLGMDGYLYISVGDKGIPKGLGRDGTTIQLYGGGVIRIRPDGTGLEVVSSGERNPLSVALTATDEIFSYGNDDDGKKWPNSLTHHIVGGHYGYPYQFLTNPERCLPIVAGQIGGSGTQGICYNEDGLPARYRGSLMFCDWGLQTVTCYQVERSGGTFKVKTKEPLVSKGDVDDFRPFSIAVSADGSALYLVDWAFSGWLAAAPKTGRLYRLTYEGTDRVSPAPRPASLDQAQAIQGLDHPAMAFRLEFQRWLARQGRAAVPPLLARVKASGKREGRMHSLWALDAIGTPEARAAIREALKDTDVEIRLQAARSTGIRRDRSAIPAISALLKDPDAAVRREAAIALGKIGDPSAAPALMAALGDADPFASWSIRRALRGLRAWDESALVAALTDPKRRDDALKLTDELWAVPVINALTTALTRTADPETRERIVANLAGLYRQYPPWSGHWFGTNPLEGTFPEKTQDWDPDAMRRVLAGLARGLNDSASSVRREAITGLAAVGKPAGPLLRMRVGAEPDAANLAALVQALGSFGDPGAVAVLSALVRDPNRPLDVRTAALDALAPFRERPAMVARLGVVYDKNAPPELVARAVFAVGQSGVLPPYDLIGFLEHKSPKVRMSALGALATFPGLPHELRAMVTARLADDSPEVQRVATVAVANLKLREAIPQLIQLAERASLHTEATRALAAMPDPQALKVYLSGLADRSPEVRRDCEAALLAIRDLVAGELESQARADKLHGTTALAVERILTRFQPVLDWRVIGPFPRTTATLFFGTDAIDFDQHHAGAGGRPVVWQSRQGEAGSGRVVLDDFKEGAGDRGGFGYDTNGSPNLAAFASAEVDSDRDREALLLAGSSGSITIELNGQPVFGAEHERGRAFAPDLDRVRIRLRRGKNRLVVLTRQGIGSWAFSVQISDPAASLFATKPGATPLDALRAYAMEHTGDPAKGEAIFFDARGIGCVRCHSAGGKGKSAVGPDLSGLALKYDRTEIIRSVLEPSRRIATGYQPTLVAFRNGQVLTGIVRGESAEDLDLADADGRVTRVLKSEIDDRRLSDVSIMPTGLIDTLSLEEFANLVAYLQSLKQPPRTAQTERTGVERR